MNSSELFLMSSSIPIMYERKMLEMKNAIAKKIICFVNFLKNFPAVHGAEFSLR